MAEAARPLVEPNHPTIEAAYANAPPDVVCELLHGALAMSPRPAPPHGRFAKKLGSRLFGPFDEGVDGPGGWIFLDAPELHLDPRPDRMQPDLAGWRRQRMPRVPREAAIRIAPDWVCEVLSPSTATLDRDVKLPLYAEHGVSFVWLVAWEQLAIFLRLLVPKLPAPKSEDATQGILDAVDLERYRIEVQRVRSLKLVEQEGVLDPVPMGAGVNLAELELERLSEILRSFYELCQQAGVKDPERAARLLAVEIPRKVAEDVSVQNALRYGDLQNARIESDRVTEEGLTDAVTDFADIFRLFMEMPGFRKAVTDRTFDEARARARLSGDAA